MWNVFLYNNLDGKVLPMFFGIIANVIFIIWPNIIDVCGDRCYCHLVLQPQDEKADVIAMWLDCG